MRRNLKASLKFTLAREGGYQCGRADRGNWTGGKLGVGQLSGTKYGISAMLLSEIRGEAVSAATMKALMPGIFYDVATSRFWNVLDCDALPDGVDLMLFDFGFNSGTERAVKQLQQLLGMSMAAQNGEMGPATLTALHEASTATIVSFLSKKYLEQFQSWLDLPSGQVSMTSLIDAVGEQSARDNLIIYALATHLGHVKSRVPVHYPFGFTSYAPIDGAVTMVVHAGGDHADPVALPPANPMTARMGGLKEGETALYDAAGQKLYFRDGRLVQVDALEELNVAIAGKTVLSVSEGKVTIDGALHVNGDVEVQGDARLDGTLTAQQDVKSAGISLKSHAHLSAQPGQPTSPPQE